MIAEMALPTSNRLLKFSFQVLVYRFSSSDLDVKSPFIYLMHSSAQIFAL